MARFSRLWQISYVVRYVLDATGEAGTSLKDGALDEEPAPSTDARTVREGQHV